MTISTICRRCAAPIPSGTRYCPQHQSSPRPSSSVRGYGHQWRLFRHDFLRTRPYCEHCAEPATEVHHLDGLGPNGPRGYDPGNCQPLCRSCHARITRSEQAPGTRAEHFARLGLNPFQQPLTFRRGGAGGSS